MKLSQEQITQIVIAYNAANSVLAQVMSASEEPPRSLVYELSAAVGVLRTLLNKETNTNIDPCT